MSLPPIHAGDGTEKQVTTVKAFLPREALNNEQCYERLLTIVGSSESCSTKGCHLAEKDAVETMKQNLPLACHAYVETSECNKIECKFS